MIFGMISGEETSRGTSSGTFGGIPTCISRRTTMTSERTGTGTSGGIPTKTFGGTPEEICDHEENLRKSS